jgi:hypothetical protein
MGGTRHGKKSAANGRQIEIPMSLHCTGTGKWGRKPLYTALSGVYRQRRVLCAGFGLGP